MSVSPARIIALGEAALMHGFALLGVETRADATAAELEQLLAELWRSDSHALVLIEQRLAAGGGPWLQRLRQEAARIVITEIPALSDPGAYAPDVDALVRARLAPLSGDEK